MFHPLKTTITYVHGTWAKNATWYDENSILRKTLEGAVKKPFLPDPFYWDGGNSLADRFNAAQRLAERLEQTVALHKGARHMVVSHSHGGNIAAKALEIAGLFGQVELICLSTPFLHINERLYTDSEKHVFLVSMCMFASVIVAGISYFILPGHVQHNPAMLCSTAVITLVALSKWVRAKSFAEENAMRIAADIPVSARMFILCASGDEALAGLGMCQALSWWLADNACALAKRSTDTTRKRLTESSFLVSMRKIVFRGFCAVITGFALLSGLEAILHIQTMIITWICLVTLLLSTLVLLAGFVMSAVDAMLPSVLLIVDLMELMIIAPLLLAVVACGRLLSTGAGVVNLLYRITADAVPAGSRTYTHFVPQSSAKMAHCATYEDPQALYALKKWIIDGVEHPKNE